MGALNDVIDEGVRNKIKLAVESGELDLWTNLDHIQEYVETYWYYWWEQLYGEGLTSQEIAMMVTIRLEHDIFDIMSDVILEPLLPNMDDVLYKSGAFWKFITSELGISFTETGSKYSWIVDGWKSTIDTRLTDLENKLAPFDAETIRKLEYVADNFELIKGIIEDDITVIIDSVLEIVRPEITTTIDNRFRPWQERLETVETIVMQHQWLFWDWLMKGLATILGGFDIPVEDLEESLETIKGWIETEVTLQLDEFKKVYIKHMNELLDLILAITEPLEKRISDLEGKAAGEAGLTEQEVRKIVQEELAGLEGIAGPQGPVGPPGPIGPAGPQGPPGPVEDGIGLTLLEINAGLYDQLTQATGITTDEVTGVIDWMLFTYGERFAELSGQITPVADFLTEDMRDELTGIVTAFDTPEALISFILDVEEGQEDAMLELMQILITMTFERGIT